MHTKSKRGFTLIELLIVIGVLAVLATVTVLVLNPAELFRQARDSQRIADLNALKDGINLYLTTVTSTNLQDGTVAFSCASNFTSDKPSVSNPFVGGTPVGAAAAYTQVSNSATTSVAGSGWVRVNFSSITLGSPISVLPVDPNRTDTNYYYGYACNNSANTFELTANMESSRYAQNGANDAESTDGGNLLSRYEVGNSASLGF